MRRTLVALVVLLQLGAHTALAQIAPTLEIESPPELAAARTRIEGYDPRPLSSLVRGVGLDEPGPPIRVVLAVNGSRWAQMVPPWAAGFAVGESGLIVLFPDRSQRYPHDTLEDVLRHEVAHVLISRAAHGRPVPRWFHEGLAVAVERPWDVEDRTRLATALLFGPRLDLAAIDTLFLGDQARQTRAYLLSAALVRHLIAAHGPGAPAAVLRQLAAGRPFDYAIASVTAQSIPTFEEAFWDGQRTWTTWVPLAASSTVLWLAVIGLAGLARRRRRQRSAELRKRWADDAEVTAMVSDDAGEGTDTGSPRSALIPPDPSRPAGPEPPLGS